MESSDPPQTGLYLLILAILLLCSMFFSASETAFLSSSRLHLRYLTKKKNPAATRVERLLAKKTLFLNTTLLGNNVVNVATSSLVTAMAIGAFGDAGVGIATVAATVVILVFGEILPKSAALMQSERIALKVSLPLRIIILALSPVVSVITFLTEGLTLLLGGRKAKDGEGVTEEDLKALIEVGEEEGVLETPERDMLHNILNYTDLNTRDIMTPRTDIAAIHIGASRDEIVELSRTSRYSRFPVYGEDIDDIRGILYIKDFLFASEPDDGAFSVRDILRPALFVFESRKISAVQKLLRSENQNLAIVIDEFGGTSGLISTEDLIAEIFGSIRDEYDSKVSITEGPRETDIDGTERIDVLNARLGTHLDSSFYDTVGGLVMEMHGDIPCVGTTVYEQGLAFEVTEMEGNRVRSLRVTRMGAAT
jgi:putative hemolysin